MNIVVGSPARFALALALILAAIVAIEVVLQKIEYDRRGNLDYFVHWGISEPEPGVAYPSWRFEEIRYRFDLDAESNIPTWYQAALLGLIAGVLFSTATVAKRSRAGHVLHWRGLAVTFVVLSLDEVAQLHELLGGRQDAPGSRLTDLFGLRDLVYFDWVAAGVAFVLILGVLLLPLFLRLPRRTLVLLTTAAGLYLLGAVGFETLAGDYGRDLTGDPMTYSLIVAAEEGLEGLGSVIAIYGFLAYKSTLEGAAMNPAPDRLTKLDLLQAISIAFLVGVIFLAAVETISSNDGGRPAAPVTGVETAPPELEPELGSETEPEEPPPDRSDCSEIASTEYRSEAERDWYLANCLVLTPEAR